MIHECTIKNSFFQEDKGIFCDISEIKLCQTNCDRFYNSKHIPHSSNSSQSEHVSRFKGQSEQSSRSSSQLEYSSRVNNILEPNSKVDNQSEHSSRSNSQLDYSSRVNNILELEHNSRFCSQSEDDSRCNSQVGKRLGGNRPRSRNNNSTLESLSRCRDQSEVSLSSELLAVPKSDFSSKLKGQFAAPSTPALVFPFVLFFRASIQEEMKKLLLKNKSRRTECWATVVHFATKAYLKSHQKVFCHCDFTRIQFKIYWVDC